MMTTGDIARRLGVHRSVVSYAIDRAQIAPAQRAGLVRLYSIDQWEGIVSAVRTIQARRSRQGRETFDA